MSVPVGVKNWTAEGSPCTSLPSPAHSWQPYIFCNCYSGCMLMELTYEVFSQRPFHHVPELGQGTASSHTVESRHIWQNMSIYQRYVEFTTFM